MAMDPEKTRREFLRGGALATAGVLAVATPQAALAADTPSKEDDPPQHEHNPKGDKAYPRDHPGSGGLVGSSTDRGKLVAGVRAAGEPPIPIVTPDLPKLFWEMKDGVKEFHLVAKHTRREFLPGAW